MELNVFQTVLIILYAFLAMPLDLAFDVGFSKPIFAGIITGIIVGDFTLGLTIGATLQLMVLGVGSYGGASVPDFMTGAIVGTVVARISGQGLEFGLAVAVPVGLLMVQLDILARFSNTFFLHRVDKAIDRLDLKAIERNVLYGAIPWGLSRSIPVAVVLIFGQEVVDVIVNDIPDWIMGGLKVAGGILPVVGIAVLLKYLPVKKFIPYLLIGFFFAAYVEVPMLGVAIVGLALAIIQFKKTSQTVPETVNEGTSSNSLNEGGYDDDEYDE